MSDTPDNSTDGAVDTPFLIYEYVKLKTGGPTMQIVNIGMDEEWRQTYQCEWTDENGQLQTGSYLADELQHVEAV